MLDIENLEFNELNIPFKVAFSHASASRNETQTIWVKITTQCGLIGYGEGCPREYVTGESLESVKQFIVNHKKEIINTIHDLDSLTSWVVNHESDIDAQPSAWCAIELALLDVMAQKQKCSVETLLKIATIRKTFTYTAVLGNNKLSVFEQQVNKYHEMGFKDYKVKLSGNFDIDNDKLNCVYKCGFKPRIRVDANNLWKSKDDVIHYFQQLNKTIFAVEEPIAPGHYNDLRSIANNLKLAIILDESFQRKSQLSFIKNDPENWILNLRVSKMGGLLRTIDIIQDARQYNIPIIIGAHVGETSLLTRAGLVVAQFANETLIAQEGAFGNYLLEYDVCDVPLQFNKNGKIIIENNMFSLPGFGLIYNDKCRI